MRRWALYFAWVVTLIGLFVSLYFGEILKVEPCRLCWYQRCCLFPLTILLGIATYRDDRNFIPYGMVLAFLGCGFAIYQWLETTFPSLRTAAICGYVNDCTESVFMLFGFMTLPIMSATGFALIFLLLLLAREKAPSH